MCTVRQEITVEGENAISTVLPRIFSRRNVCRVTPKNIKASLASHALKGRLPSLKAILAVFGLIERDSFSILEPDKIVCGVVEADLVGLKRET